jgi:hypothetical protein
MEEMTMGKRKSAVDILAALNAGGIDALRAAEALTDGETNINIRVGVARKQIYVAAAKRKDMTLTAWLIALADEGAR